MRLNLGRHQPTLPGNEDRRVKLHVTRGKQVNYRGLRYKGNVWVNVAGVWRKGLREPLWVISNPDPEEGLPIYQRRTKTKQSFKDLKSLLCIDKVMPVLGRQAREQEAGEHGEIAGHGHDCLCWWGRRCATVYTGLPSVPIEGPEQGRVRNGNATPVCLCS